MAILNSPCAQKPPPANCSGIDLLDLYVRRADTAVVANLCDWATRAVAARTITTAPPIVHVVRLS